MTTPTRTPRFNHVAMSVPSELLGEDGRRDLVRFYDEVFGWKELPTETVDGKRLRRNSGKRSKRQSAQAS